MRLLAIGSWVAVGVLSGSVLATRAQAIAPADLAELEAGQTVVRTAHQDGMAGIEAEFTIHAAPQAVFAILDDTARMVEYMPAMNACTILERGPGYVVAKMVGDSGELVERRSSHPPDRIEWTLVHGTALRDLKGHWLLEPFEGGTLLHYVVVVQPALPIPSGIVSYFQSRNLPAMVHHVRARVVSGGTWVKPEYHRPTE